MYISEKTLLSKNALLYTVARQTSQGRECSYNVTKLERQNACEYEDEEDYAIDDGAISRAYTSNTQQEIMRGVSAGAETYADDDTYYEHEQLQRQNAFTLQRRATQNWEDLEEETQNLMALDGNQSPNHIARTYDEGSD